MSSRIQDSYTVPEKTAEVARVVFPKGNIITASPKARHNGKNMPNRSARMDWRS